jgi:hypothetical protein
MSFILNLATVGSMANQWTDWQSWGACSVTCGYGVMTRVRQCHDNEAIIEDRRCTGSSKENKTCSISECERNAFILHCVINF